MHIIDYISQVNIVAHGLLFFLQNLVIFSVCFFLTDLTFPDKGDQREPKGTNIQNDYFFILGLICMQFFHQISWNSSCLKCSNRFVVVFTVTERTNAQILIMV